MRPAVDAFQQHAVNLLAKLFDAVHYFDAVLLAGLLGESLQAVCRGRDVRRAAGICGDDLAAVILGRVVYEFCEGGDMRGIETYNAEAKDFLFGMVHKRQCQNDGSYQGCQQKIAIHNFISILE